MASSSSSSRSQQQQKQQRAMPFQLFLEKMRQPSAAELVSGIKQFINTFVVVDEVDVEEGKSENNRSNNSSNSKRDPARDSEKIQRFLREYAEKFRRHSLWRNCSQEEVEVRSFFIIILSCVILKSDSKQASTEGLEKYVCTKLYATIFNSYGEEDDAINEALQKRIEALRNLPLTPEMLDVSRKQFLLLGEEEGGNEGDGRSKEEKENGEAATVVDGAPMTPSQNNGAAASSSGSSATIPKSLRLASLELEKMNTYKAPRDKMNCILNACRIISNAVLRFSGGADAFIPSLIYSLAHANVQNLWKNIKYIERFRLRDRLEQGEAAYFFINVESGARFLGTCGKEQLNIFSDEKDDSFPEPVDGLTVSFSASREVLEEEKEKEKDQKQAARSHHLTPEQPATPPFNGFVVSTISNNNNTGDENDTDVENRAPPLATTTTITDIQNEIEILETMGASLSLGDNSNDSEYHFINADHEHLTIGDIKTLLISYKNLANKYEALKRGIEMKLRESYGNGESLRIRDSYSSSSLIGEEALGDNEDDGGAAVTATAVMNTTATPPPSVSLL